MARAAPQKRARAPRRPPPVYQVVVIPPVQADPRAVTALLTWLAERGKR